MLFVLNSCGPVCTEPVMVSRARCCDGTAANCTSRGCCSHHGGVCYSTITENRVIDCPVLIDASSSERN